MKRYICFFTAIVLLLSFIACSKSSNIVSTLNSGKRMLSEISVSAEIVSKKTVDADSEIKMIIGFGRLGRIDNPYQAARLTVSAPGFTVYAPDGTESDGVYKAMYEDFDDDKYCIGSSDDSYVIQYFEEFRFRYSETERSSQGEIWISVLSFGSDGEILIGNGVYLFYKAHNGNVTVSTKRLWPVETHGKLTEIKNIYTTR